MLICFPGTLSTKSIDELLKLKDDNFFIRLAIVKNLEQTNPDEFSKTGESWQWITGFIENQRHSPLGYGLLQRYAARACLQLKLGKDIPQVKTYPAVAEALLQGLQDCLPKDVHKEIKGDHRAISLLKGDSSGGFYEKRYGIGHNR